MDIYKVRIGKILYAIETLRNMNVDNEERLKSINEYIAQFDSMREKSYRLRDAIAINERIPENLVNESKKSSKKILRRIIIGTVIGTPITILGVIFLAPIMALIIPAYLSIAVFPFAYKEGKKYDALCLNELGKILVLEEQREELEMLEKNLMELEKPYETAINNRNTLNERIMIINNNINNYNEILDAYENGDINALINYNDPVYQAEPEFIDNDNAFSL